MILYIEIDRKLCVGCGDCLCICPVGAICMQDGKAAVNDGCVCCGACIKECTKCAISLLK